MVVPFAAAALVRLPLFAMHDLQLVGFTTDRRGLIFRPRVGARSDAGFVVPITDELVALIAEIAEEQASVEPAPGRADPVGQVAAVEPATRPRSHLSVRDIQARLRAGERVAQVATEAGVDEDWIERFAPPIRAEQRRVIDRALEHHLQRGRSAASAVPLRRAVGMSLADKGIAYTVDAFEAAWSSHLLGHDRWTVSFTYRHRGRDRTASWTYDAAANELTTSDRTAAQLGYVAPGADDSDAQAVDGIVGDPEAKTKIGTASAGSRAGRSRSSSGAKRSTSTQSTTKKAPAKRIDPAAGPAGPAAERGATQGEATTKRAAIKKPAVEKPAVEKGAGEKAAAKRVAVKKAAARKTAAKRVPVKKGAAAKKAAARKVAAERVAVKKAAAARKVAAERVAVKKAAARKAAAEKAATTRAAAKRTADERVAAKKAVASKVAAERAVATKRAAATKRVEAATKKAAVAKKAAATKKAAVAKKAPAQEKAAAVSERVPAERADPDKAPPQAPTQDATPVPARTTTTPPVDVRKSRAGEGGPTRASVAGRPTEPVPARDRVRLDAAAPDGTAPETSPPRSASAAREVVAAPEPPRRPAHVASRLPDEPPRPAGDRPSIGSRPGRLVAGRPGDVDIAEVPLAGRPPTSNGRPVDADRSSPPDERERRRPTTVQFRSGSAAPVRAAGSASGVRRSPEPDRSRGESAPSKAADTAAARRRQLRAR